MLFKTQFSYKIIKYKKFLNTFKPFCKFVIFKLCIIKMLNKKKSTFGNKKKYYRDVFNMCRERFATLWDSLIQNRWLIKNIRKSWLIKKYKNHKCNSNQMEIIQTGFHWRNQTWRDKNEQSWLEIFFFP